MPRWLHPRIRDLGHCGDPKYWARERRTLNFEQHGLDQQDRDRCRGCLSRVYAPQEATEAFYFPTYVVLITPHRLSRVRSLPYKSHVLH